MTACVLLLFGSCRRNTKSETNLNHASVRVLTVGQDNSHTPTEYVGTVESSNTVNVSFLTGGTIERMLLSEGESVRKGQLMATVNTTSVQNSHNAALASLRQAEDAYKRMKEMYDNQSLPEIQFIDIKTKLEQAKASEATTRKLLSDASLYAPESGVISRKYVEPGTNAAPGTPVYTIMNIQEVNMMIPVPEGEISRFKTGQKCSIRVTALDNQHFEGEVIEKGISANPISHTYPVKISVRHSEGKLMPGMVAKVWIDNNTPNDAQQRISIPIKNVLLDYPDTRFVWIIDGNNKAQRRNVSLGSLTGNQVEITEGLSPGDRIVTDGYQFIGPDTSVEIVP